MISLEVFFIQSFPFIAIVALVHLEPDGENVLSSSRQLLQRNHDRAFVFIVVRVGVGQLEEVLGVLGEVSHSVVAATSGRNSPPPLASKHPLLKLLVRFMSGNHTFGCGELEKKSIFILFRQFTGLL